MSTSTYGKIMLIGLYRKPVFILTTLFGIYYIIGLATGYFTPIGYDNEIYFEFLMGLFILFAPLIITMISVKQFNSNPSFKNDMKYTFSEIGMSVEGITFKGEFTWKHIIKEKEISNFLILYHSAKMGNFIDKTKLNPEQLKFIKDKVVEK